jgi:chemotaxis protein methyltransferase CheR
MTDDEFKIFRDLIHRECGISLNDNKKDFLRVRVEKRLKALDQRSFFQYYKYVTEKNRDELCLFIDSVTINETSFFRNIPQFEMFREKVLPEVIERKRLNRDYNLGIWSAGCATGEEPYSIAMGVVEAIPDISLWKINIIASDISLRCLEIANKGIYPMEKLKEVPERYKSKCFKQSGENFEVKDSIKKFVVFDYHNLKHENGIANIDIIFCRNVMIYFDADEQKRIVERFNRVLRTNGYLFLGHAETLNPSSAVGS